MSLETLVPPALEPITLAAARAFLRIGSDGDDSVLTSLLIGAREALEARTGKALVTRTLRQRFFGAGLDPRTANLPNVLVPARGPASALVAVRTIAADGSEAAAPTGLVRLLDGRFVLNPSVSPAHIGLSIDYQAGYGPSANAVPEAFKLSILDAVADALVRRDNGSGATGGVSPMPNWEQRLNEVKL
ncbi:MAG: hypothetical protein RL186_1586 [Pseudomonadota bacterium]